MADVITRFKLETTQFDSKLRDAAKSLKEVGRMAEIGGKDFVAFSQKQTEAARALGQTASGANNARDKVKDLVGAFNDAAKAYNNLSQAQQQSDFGKNLSASLAQLKERITEAKQELYGLGDAAKSIGGGAGGGGRFLDMISVAGGNLIASGVQKLGSELADTIEQSIELARQGEGVRMAFERLNRPGLLDTLKEATHGTVSELELMQQAIKFDNFKLPVEDLATYLGFAQQKAKDTGESIDYLVNSIVTGLGRQSVMILDNLGISASEIRNRMKEGGDMTKAVAEIIREEMAKAGDYIETAADRAARAAADAKNKMENLGRTAMPVAEEWAKTWNSIKMGGITLLNEVLTPIVNSAKEIRDLLNGIKNWKITPKPGVTNIADDPNVDDNGNYINKTWNSKGMSLYSSIDNIPEITVSGTRKQKTTRTTPRTTTTTTQIVKEQTELQENQKKINDLTLEYVKLGDDATDGAKSRQEEIRKEIQLLEQRNSKIKLYQENAQGKYLGGQAQTTGLAPHGVTAVDPYIYRSIGKGLEMKNPLPTNSQKKKETDDQKMLKDVSSIVGAVGSITSGVENLGFEIPEQLAKGLGILQTMSGIISAILAITTLIKGEQTVQTTTGILDAIIPFARGGVVKAASGTVVGNTYSGDQILTALNAGEVVLNKAQTAALASSIQSEGSDRGGAPSFITGEQIYVVLNRFLSRIGEGEICTWKQ